MSVHSYTALCSVVTLQSNKDGFFLNFANAIENLVDSEWLNSFANLPNEKKLLKCLTDKKIRNEVLQTLDNVQEIYRGKSARLSQQRRQEAEQFYKKKKSLDKSLLVYTQSVIRAPVAGIDKSCDDGLSLALALWGRSAVLFDLKKYQLCLDDVKLALQERLPEILKLDAYWRMTECYINLELYDQARVSLNILLKFIKTKKDVDGSVWLMKVEDRLKEIETKHSPKSNSKADTDPSQTLTGGPHEIYGKASAKMRLAESIVAGKHFIAQEPINTGDTLITEDPYVRCLAPEKYNSHCHNCLQRLETGIPCPDCSAVAFCSLKCRLEATKSYHKYECRYLDLLIGSGMSVLSFAALRIVTQQPAKYFVDALENGRMDHPYNQIQTLVTHEDKRTGTDFLNRTLMALFLLVVLKKGNYFPHPVQIDLANPHQHEILIARVILRNLEILQFNAHEIFEPVKFKNSNKPVKAFNIGVGLYKTASYLNHDCYPAVSRFFLGTKLVIKAVRPLRPNEAVGDNYGPAYIKHDLAERQQKLLSRYWFKCECCSCLQNWPTGDALKDEVFLLKCQTCNASINHRKNAAESVCKNCSKSCAGVFDQVLEIRKALDGLKQDETRSNEETIEILCKLQDSLEDFLHPPHRMFNDIQEQLTQIFMQYGKVYYAA